MVITRTPFRISFFGGGTDYPVWYEENKGAVLSTTINKHCYITCRRLPPFFEYNYRIRYTEQEYAKTIDEIKHPSVRECLKFMGIDYGIEMQHNADLPAMSGLGSSSSFTVGLLNSLYALSGKMVTKRQLALNAMHVEQERIKENVGSQDQTAAAFGGLNKIEFGGPQHVTVSPIALGAERLDLFQNHLLLFFSGFSRNASSIAGEQIMKIKENANQLRRIMDITEQAFHILTNPSMSLATFGDLLNEHWELKRTLSSVITNPAIDEMYTRARRAGALGGKLLGAGGGGFMLFFVKPEDQSEVKRALKDLLCVPFRFENLGSQIIYYAPEERFS